MPRFDFSLKEARSSRTTTETPSSPGNTEISSTTYFQPATRAAIRIPCFSRGWTKGNEETTEDSHSISSHSADLPFRPTVKWFVGPSPANPAADPRFYPKSTMVLSNLDYSLPCKQPQSPCAIYFPLTWCKGFEPDLCIGDLIYLWLEYYGTFVLYGIAPHRWQMLVQLEAWSQDPYARRLEYRVSSYPYDTRGLISVGTLRCCKVRSHQQWWPCRPGYIDMFEDMSCLQSWFLWERTIGSAV